MLHDELLSDIEWTAQLAAINANACRMVEAFSVVTQQYPLYAKQYRLYYQALIAEGFTPEQAFEIVKAHGWIPR